MKMKLLFIVASLFMSTSIFAKIVVYQTPCGKGKCWVICAGKDCQQPGTLAVLTPSSVVVEGNKLVLTFDAKSSDKNLLADLLKSGLKVEREEVIPESELPPPPNGQSARPKLIRWKPRPIPYKMALLKKDTYILKIDLVS